MEKGKRHCWEKLNASAKKQTNNNKQRRSKSSRRCLVLALLFKINVQLKLT